MTIDSAAELEEKLVPLMHKWHCGARQGNDGNAGNTLEDLLGIKENNLSLPDFGDIEIKTQEYETGSLLTMFHSEPKPNASVPKLLKALGWKHSKAGNGYPAAEMSFRSTTYAHRSSVRGFSISLVKDKLQFVFDPSSVETSKPDVTGVYRTYGDWLKDVNSRTNPNYKDIFPIYYALDDLKNKFSLKLEHTFIVMYRSKKVDGLRHFLFEEAYVGRNLLWDKITSLMSDGGIVVDFDARTGHNHGTKFRIERGKIPALFDKARVIR
jgi:hypothetical protein